MASNFLAVKFFIANDSSLVVPLFTRVDRRAFFAATLDTIFEHFQRQKLDHPLHDLDQIWLSHQGRPLAWESPVGVAFDKFCAATAADPNKEPVPLPFPIAVHAAGKPDSLGSCSDERLRSHYMNTLKQASFLRFGSAQPIMEMNKAAQAGLWQGLKAQDMVRVEDCLRSTQFRTPEMKFVPVRLLVGLDAAPIQFRVRRHFDDKGAGGGDGDGGGDVRGGRRPSELVTLGDLLNSWIPEYPLFAGRDYGEVANTLVFTDGLCLPFNTPLGVLYDELKYYDMYLYVCVGILPPPEPEPEPVPQPATDSGTAAP